MLKVIGLVAAVLVLSATSARAVDCDSVVVDDGHLFSDIKSVEQGARQLGDAGSTVRVRTFGGVGGKGNLDRHVVDLRNQCRDWQSPDGHGWKSTMLVMAYANEGRQKGVYYGSAIQGKVGDGKWITVLRAALVPLEVAYWAGEKAAMGQGFVAALGGLQSLMAATPGGGTTIINNARPTDYSYVWLILMGLLGGSGAIYFGWMWLLHRGQEDSAQREAKRVRALCVSGLSEISSQTTEDVLGAIVESETAAAKKVVGLRMISEFKQYVRMASEALSRFDEMSGSDPNAAKLSEKVYESNKRMYSQIIDDYITPARRLMMAIKGRDFSGKDRPMKEDPRKSKAHTSPLPPGWQNRQRPIPAASQAPYQPVPTAGNTTAVHHHYDSGPAFIPIPVVVERETYTPRSSRPHDDDSGGSSSSWGGSSSSSSSSDSGGSFSSSDSGSSSSDSGGSFGSSD